MLVAAGERCRPAQCALALKGRPVPVPPYQLTSILPGSNIELESIVAEITASMVKELRAKTDAPMMECKKALVEANGDRKSTRLNSSHVAISYAVFCLKKKMMY